MNFAIDLIMAGIFFSLADIRTFGGFDLFPDFIGVLFSVIAIVIAKKYSGEMRNAAVPAAICLILSFGDFYNFVNDKSEGIYIAIYLLWKTAYIISELRMYSKLLYACEEFYDSELTGKDKTAIVLYGVSSILGAVISFMVWKYVTSAGLTEPFAVWNIVYYVYFVLHTVITSFLIYRFYLLKPKFR